MSDPREAIDTLQNMTKKNLVLPVGLFILLPHVSNQLDSLRKR